MDIDRCVPTLDRVTHGPHNAWVSPPRSWVIEGGWLHEIGDAFLELMDELTLPEGSVILLGSLSDLMNQGSAGHAKALCREVRRFSVFRLGF